MAVREVYESSEDGDCVRVEAFTSDSGEVSHQVQVYKGPNLVESLRIASRIPNRALAAIMSDRGYDSTLSSACCPGDKCKEEENQEPQSEAKEGSDY